MRQLRRLLRFFGGLALTLLLLFFALVTKQDKTPLADASFFQQWKESLGDAHPSTGGSSDSLYAGWSKTSITPDAPGPMAGYGKRRGKHYTQIHDSVFVRSVVLESGALRAAIVSADLLIIPPTVTARLKQLLTDSDIPFENIYFGATHTHNSVGGWGTGISGLFFSGPYDPEVEIFLAEAILTSLRTSSKKLSPVSLTYQEGNNSANIKNRLIGEQGTIDTELRSVLLAKKTGEKLTLVSFGAHSTVLSSRTMQLSRDWPGILMDSLDQGNNFGLYLAGAVGSMGPQSSGSNDLEEMVDQANGVYETLKAASPDSTIDQARLSSLTLPLPLGASNPRITKEWALRSWVFDKAFGVYPNEIRALRIGNVLMVGVPCDFSGELMAPIDRYARERGLNLIVTSFNGGYIGYITDDKWYNLDRYETVTMNWFGPYKGAYFQTVINDLVDLMD